MRSYREPANRRSLKASSRAQSVTENASQFVRCGLAALVQAMIASNYDDGELTASTHTERPSTPVNVRHIGKKKEQDIRAACEEADIHKLQALAESEGGLLTDTLRQLACNYSSFLSPANAGGFDYNSITHHCNYSQGLYYLAFLPPRQTPTMSHSLLSMTRVTAGKSCLLIATRSKYSWT